MNLKGRGRPSNRFLLIGAGMGAAVLSLLMPRVRAEGFFDWLKRDRSELRTFREGQSPQPRETDVRSGQSGRPAAPLVSALPLPAGVAGGNIVFTKLVPRTVLLGATAVPLPIPKLFVMTGEGANARECLSSPGVESFKDPCWSPGYKVLLFVSDYQYEASACMEDIFTIHADGAGLRRLTGAQPAAVAAYGSAQGVVLDDAQHSPAPLAVTQINITGQGGGAEAVHPQPMQTDGANYRYPFVLPHVAAGKVVWIKIWKDKYTSVIKLTEIVANQVNNVGEIYLRGNALFAAKPSSTPDGRYATGIGSLASLQPPSLPGAPLPVISGVDSLCVYDAANNGALVQSFDPPTGTGESVKDPIIAPDGQRVALCWGTATRENLALIRMQDLLTKQFNPQVLVQGGIIFPSETTGFQAVGSGNATPAWSPDGRTLAFSRILLGTQIVTAQIYLVNADGTGLRQLTHCAANQAAFQPCFSPDGQHVAFAVLTGKTGVIKPEDLAARNCTSDLCTIGLDGSGLRSLTNDGVSGSPAWGP